MALDINLTYLDQAIEISRGSECKPGHPFVGAVIVKGGQVLATAAKKLNSHAEFRALKIAKESGRDIRGSVIYTTLEPCTHRNSDDGRRSCAEWLAESGIAAVVIGLRDNNPDISGRAVDYLLKKGICVVLAPVEYQEKIAKLNKEFLAKARKPEDVKLINQVG